jgi:hypothetical protein
MTRSNADATNGLVVARLRAGDGQRRRESAGKGRIVSRLAERVNALAYSKRSGFAHLGDEITPRGGLRSSRPVCFLSSVLAAPTSSASGHSCQFDYPPAASALPRTFIGQSPCDGPSAVRPNETYVGCAPLLMRSYSRIMRGQVCSQRSRANHGGLESVASC